MIPWKTREQDIDTREQDKDKHQEEEKNQDVEEFQAMEEDENLAEVASRTLAPLPQLYFSPHTPMLSSVLKAQHTPKPSVKKTTADNLRTFQPRYPSSPRHRRSHTSQTPTQALPISKTYRKPSDSGPRWQPTSVSKQRFRAPQCPNQTLPISEDSEYSLNTLSEDDFGRKVYCRRPFQSRPISSPREVASPSSSTLIQSPSSPREVASLSSSTLIQSPVKFGTAAQTFSFNLGSGAATEFKASQQLPGPRVSHHVEERVLSDYDNPSNEIISSEPTAERTYISVNLSEGPGPHKRRRNTQVSAEAVRKLSDRPTPYKAKRQKKNEHVPGRRTPAPELLSDQEQPLDSSAVASRSSRRAIRTAPIPPPSPRTPTRLNPNPLESPANSLPRPTMECEYAPSIDSASSLPMSPNTTQSRIPSPRTLAANNEEESMRGSSLIKQEEIKEWADKLPKLIVAHHESRLV